MIQIEKVQPGDTLVWMGKCEIWSDTASNVDSIRVSLYGKPREF